MTTITVFPEKHESPLKYCAYISMKKSISNIVVSLKQQHTYHAFNFER